ncbi:MAG: phage/plasmid primase, P4 family [Phycisphaerae bacterium]|nr:phage/plasmid primase, P4 family [Phycisphaerae bacterium]
MKVPALQFDPTRVCREVPSCLRERRQWVCWRFIVRGGKTTKCPICPNGVGEASSTDPATWGTFDQAVAACQAAGLEGIGFVFSADDPFAGVDLDKCIDPTTGEPKPWATAILDKLDSYSEVSPSGTGVKVFVSACKPGPRCKTGYEDGAIEMYDRDRYFTVTGQSLDEPPKEVAERQGAVDALYAQVFGAPPTARAAQPDPSNNGQLRLDDDEILRLACANRKSGAKFASLRAGRWNDHFNSRSEADSSVVFTLAYYSKDAGQLDRIFRRSGLMREKWDEQHGQQTYGEMTIAKALATVARQYKPRKRRQGAKSSGGIDGGPLSGEPPPGTVDPVTGRLILSTERTLPTAEAFVRRFHQHSEGITLRHYASMLMQWHANRYVEIEDDAVRNRLLPWLHAAVRMTYNPKAEDWVAEDFPANPHTVKAALESIKAHTHLPATTASPSWLVDDTRRPDPREIVPCRSSLLHLPTMRMMASTPAFFSVSALDFDHDPAAPEPAQWRAFLGQLFEDDLACWDLLQEWFGYCLTGDTSQHKMLLIVGPRRSGKGTIARVLTRLVGPANVCGPTTTSLAGLFGLQPLIGKSLAIVSDARFSGKDVQTVVERLLCISGEDSLTIDRKHMTSVTMKLPTRFVFLTNELPRLTDASGALSGRFMMLRLTESFYGREDRTLTTKLLTELPGILNWSIEGWRQLRARGHFVQPASVEDALRDMEDLSSPVGAFVRERCDVDPGLRVWVDDLYQAWKNWCEADGRVKATTKQTFGRDLMAAVPGITTRLSTAARFYQGIALKGVSG